jgi:threonine/homoserine/homoserine lactone efflux protein
MLIENIIKIVITNGAILIIPGLNFSFVLHISMNRGIKFGLITAFGITLGIMSHVAFAMMGSYEIFTKFPILFNTIKWAGVLYIIWFAISLTRPLKILSLEDHDDLKKNKSLMSYFRDAYFIDLLNPFVTAFYISLFSQIMSTNVKISHLSIYSFIIFLITLGWFSIASIFFSQSVMRRLYEKNHKKIRIISACLLLYFAVQLALA